MITRFLIVLLMALSCLCRTQTITTIAGGGNVVGDGGPGTSAQLVIPSGVAVDASGNVYIADVDDHRVRKVDPSGIITTIAGDGTPGSTGDGGPAAWARLYGPHGVHVDAAGNIYIADTRNHRVRKINTNGIISTIAGTGVAGSSGDGGNAVNAELFNPLDVSVALGDIYIAQNAMIRRISSTGIITTVAGGNGSGYNGDGIPATTAWLNSVYSVAADQAGNFYIGDAGANRVRKVNSAGIISTLAGNGTGGFSGDGGAAANAQLNYPYGVALDAAGNVYVSDYFGERVRKINPGGIISTVAGKGNMGFSGDGGPALNAQLSGPRGIEIGPSGDLFIVDGLNLRVRGITCNKPVISAVSSASLICAGESATLTGQGGVLYSFGQGLTSAGVSVSPGTTTSYTVTGYNANGCQNTAVLTQSVETCTSFLSTGQKASLLRVFPNPTQGRISIDNGSSHLQLQVSDGLGRIILSVVNEAEIDLKPFSVGIYYLRITSASGTEVLKIIKE